MLPCCCTCLHDTTAFCCCPLGSSPTPCAPTHLAGSGRRGGSHPRAVGGGRGRSPTARLRPAASATTAR